MKDKNRKYVNEAESGLNGIIFLSNKNPDICCETYLDDTGAIRDHMYFKPFKSDQSKLNSTKAIEEKHRWNKKKFTIYWLVISVITLVLCLLLGNVYWVISASLFCLNVIPKVFLMLQRSSVVKDVDENGLSIAKFHSAEHMVCNAYTTLQRVPSLEEIKKFSRFNKSCGSRENFSEICMFFLLSIAALLVQLGSIYYIFAVTAIVIFHYISLKFNPLRFMQLLITSPPTDTELLLAIKALENFEYMEEHIKEIEVDLILGELLPNIVGSKIIIATDKD